MALAGIFPSDMTSETVADVEAALATNGELLTRNLCKTHFRDMVRGFRILVSSLERKETETFEIVVKWLRLYLKMQAIPITNQLRKEFEKTVPSVVTYIIGSLQHKPKNHQNYHYELLSMTMSMLENCSPTTVEKLANFQTGLIASLWIPINFVGDFNTQMMVLRLLVMLLKCADNVRRQSEIEKIRCPQRNQMQEKLSSAIVVANHQAGKFENTARDILNNYNMNVARDVLVYSFCCTTLQFGEKFSFFKTLSAEHFWIDLNYCPRTLTFNGRYQGKHQSRFANVSVGFNIRGMKLEHNTLTVHFGPPAQFSKKLINAKELLLVNFAKLELPTNEARRLQENDFIFEYYNKSETQTHSNISVARSYTSSDNDQDTDRIEFPPTPQLDEVVLEAAADVDSTPNPLNTNFQRSYEFLCGSSGEAVNADVVCTSQTDNVFETQSSQTENIGHFKQPSLPKYEQAVHRIKAARVQKKSQNKKQNLSEAEVVQALQDESPRTSRSTDVERPSNSQDSHPISKLRKERKFFKTLNRNQNTSGEQKTVRGRKPNNSKSKSNKSSTANMTVDTLQQPLKQINKVKPMIYLSQPDPVDAALEDLENGNIINMTNFLNNGNESSLVFNENQRRTILENVQRALTPNSLDTHETAAPQTTAQSSHVDVYAVVDVSDAEPGISYRNFRTRPPVIPSVQNKTKVRRTRKLRSKKEPTAKSNAQQPSTSKEPKRSRKRGNSTQVVAGAKASPPPTKKPRFTTKENKSRKCMTKNYYDGSTTSETEVEIDAQTPDYINDLFPSEQPNIMPATLEAAVPSTSYTGTQQRQLSVDVEDKDAEKKRKAFVKRYFRGSTSSESEMENDAALSPQTTLTNPNQLVETNAEIEVCRQRMAETSFENLRDITTNTSISNSRSNSRTNHVQTVESDDDDIVMLSQGECTLYHEHSEYSDSDTSDKELPPQSEESIYVSTPTKTISVQNVATTTTTTISKCRVSTSITTKRRRTCHDVMQIAAEDNVTEERHELALRNLTETTNTSTISNDLTKYSNDITLDVSPRILGQESNNLKDTFQQHLSADFEKLIEKKTAADVYFEKANEIGARIFDEIERQQQEQAEVKRNIEKIMSQVNWQYETYKKNSLRLMCFKSNAETLLEALSEVNIKEEIDKKYDDLLSELDKATEKLSGRQWRDYIQESTDQMLKNMNNLSQL